MTRSNVGTSGMSNAAYNEFDRGLAFPRPVLAPWEQRTTQAPYAPSIGMAAPGAPLQSQAGEYPGHTSTHNAPMGPEPLQAFPGVTRKFFLTAHEMRN